MLDRNFMRFCPACGYEFNNPPDKPEVDKCPKCDILFLIKGGECDNKDSQSNKT